jgi:hypothetical protein
VGSDLEGVVAVVAWHGPDPNPILIYLSVMGRVSQAFYRTDGRTDGRKGRQTGVQVKLGGQVGSIRHWWGTCVLAEILMGRGLRSVAHLPWIGKGGG